MKNYFMLNIGEYVILTYFFFISLILCLILLSVSFLLSSVNPNSEKVSAYECGFEPFNDSRITFDVHFYIVAILYVPVLLYT